MEMNKPLSYRAANENASLEQLHFRRSRTAPVDCEFQST
jgi:hypothetical protein